MRDNEPENWFGRTNPVTGLSIYSEVGWMSVQISGTKPGRLTREGYDKASDEDKFLWMKEYYAYYGRFETDDATSKVTITIADSLFPERSTTIKRTFEFRDNLMILLTEPRIEDGKSVYNRLVWQRAS